MTSPGPMGTHCPTGPSGPAGPGARQAGSWPPGGPSRRAVRVLGQDLALLAWAAPFSSALGGMGYVMAVSKAASKRLPWREIAGDPGGADRLLATPGLLREGESVPGEGTEEAVLAVREMAELAAGFELVLLVRAFRDEIGDEAVRRALDAETAAEVIGS